MRNNSFPHRMQRPMQKMFFDWGWLLVAALPLAQLSRPAFTVLGLGFLLWGLGALTARKNFAEPRMLALYFVLIAIFFFSIVGAANAVSGFKAWAVFVLYGFVSFIVLSALHEPEADTSALLDAFALSSMVILVLLYLDYAIDVQRPGFSPELNMAEDNLPLLIPFLLYWLQYRLKSAYRLWFVWAAIGIVSAYVVLSHGRAALVGLTVGLCAYCYFVLRWRLRSISCLGIGLILVSILFSGESFFRWANPGQSLTVMLDSVSTYRTALWRQAIDSPPENIWFGFGMANAPGIYIAGVPGASTDRYVKHLHNFLLDCWYETGILGLFALLVWLGYLLRRGVHNWKCLGEPYRLHAGVLLAASSAILSNALLSYSYTSKQFACYLFLFLSVAASLEQIALQSRPINLSSSPDLARRQ